MKVFRGALVHCTREGALEILPDTYIGVDANKIKFIKDASESRDIGDNYDVINLAHGEFLMPGLVDCHIHASQYSNAGKALDLPLLEWLNAYTFPTEAKFKELDFANDIYNRVVRRVVRGGTTTACYFATIHTEASLKLCDVIESVGQRAYVGKVNMDQNSPENYVEETMQSVQDTEAFIQQVQARKNPLLSPVVTPRFAPATSETLMKELGALVRKYDVPVQTHLAETRNECKWVKQLYPSHESYTDVYHKCGLLTNKSVLAHGVYVSDEEMDIMRQTGAGIAHCPNSNISLKSGLCDVQRLLQHKVKVGLGTDVSGGYSPSILDAMRQAIHTSNIISVQHQDPNYQPLDFRSVFRLATLGGAQVLGLADKIGNFEVGKEFDALHVSLSCPESPVDIYDGEDVQDFVQKFIFLGDDRNIRSVYVAGEKLDV